MRKWMMVILLLCLPAISFCIEKRKEKLKFGSFEFSEFRISGEEYAFIVGISGLNFQDFVESGGSLGKTRYSHAGIMDVEKCISTEIDNYMCEQITNINQLFFCGWAQRAGYANEYELYEELVKNPEILKKYPTIYDYVFRNNKLLKYNLYRYQSMFRMVSNDDVSLRQPKTMCYVERYLRELNCLVYLQLDYGEFGNRKMKERGHALTMYGFTYDMSKPKNSPERYTGVIVADSDNDKVYKKSIDAPNSITILPITWDNTNKIYIIYAKKIGYIRFFLGLEGK